MPTPTTPTILRATARSNAAPRHGLAALALTVAALGPAGCALAYPRYTTSEHPAPAEMASGGELTPPPENYHRISALRAEVPPRTRDGRDWDSDGGPDPFVVVYRNGREIYRSQAVQNNLRPEWDPARDHGDVQIDPGDRLRVELREQDGVGSELVGLAEMRGVPPEARHGGNWTVRLEGGASVELQDDSVPPRFGMGITFDFRGDSVGVLEVLPASPAHNADLRAGDKIVAIDGQTVSALGELRSRQALDQGWQHEVRLTVRRDGHDVPITVRRDALYRVQ